MTLRKLLLIIAALGVLWYIWSVHLSSDKSMNSGREEKFTRPVRGRISSRVTATGSIVSNFDVEIKCKASGEIISLPFDVSDRVRKGDLLLELDPKDEERKVKQQEVSLRAAEARLAQAKQNLEIAIKNLEAARIKSANQVLQAKARATDAKNKEGRIEKLYALDLASLENKDSQKVAAIVADAELKNALAALEEVRAGEMALEVKKHDVMIAESQVEAQKLSLELAKQSLADTRVYSPVDGVVTDRKAQIGQIISSGITNVGGGTTIMTIADLSKVYVLASVDESDIARVKVGQKVKITLDAYGNREFAGEVVRIGARGQTVSNVVTFEVKIEVHAEKKELELLKPQMTANVEIITAEKEGAIILPLDSVFERRGKKIVKVKTENGELREKEVITGLQDDRSIEIISGLSMTEEVLVSRTEAMSRWRRSSESENAARRSNMRRMHGPMGF